MKQKIYNLVVVLLEFETRLLLNLKNVEVVGVTGSVGKTSTKLAIAEVLKRKYRVLVHEGNYNTEIGLPLSCFNIDSPKNPNNPLEWARIFVLTTLQLIKKYPYDVIVLEMGADRPGDIKRFMRYITPRVGVLTAVERVHTEEFGTLENVYKEKSQLAFGSQNVVINADDNFLVNRLKGEFSKGSIYEYSIEKNTDWHLENIQRRENYKLSARFCNKETFFAADTNFVATHNLRSLLAACVVGELFKIETEEIKEAIINIKPVKGRMNLLEGKNNSYILDDSYNSSPASAIRALNTLQEIEAERKIVVLGSMNELGEYEKEGHEAVGRKAAELNIDILVAIGEAAQNYLVSVAMEDGLDKNKIYVFNSPYEAGDMLAEKIKEGDFILVKGSQNKVFAEETIKPLLKNEKDKKHLVRQSEKWLKKKQEQFS